MTELYTLFWTLPALTQSFIVAIGVMTIAMVGPTYNERTASTGPTVLTMLGIFGCFFGIALGLQDFQAGDVQGSIPHLLLGIKTAFWSSVAGIFGALILKARFLVLGPPRHDESGTSEGATIDDLVKLLQKLNQSLSGKDDSTLISQIKLLRQDNIDGFAELRSSFDHFAQEIAKNNTDALIAALSKVIRDFNLKLSEQFGENFKELNAAVKDLVNWQQAYREQMAEMIELQRSTTANMSKAVSDYSNIVGHAEKFTKTADSLGSLLTSLETQRNQLANSLTLLANLVKSAGDGLPKIETKITEMTKQIESSVKANNDQIATVVKSSGMALQASHTEMSKLLVDSTEKMNANFRKLSEDSKERILALDKQLGEELTKSISTLGTHLTALSKKFVDDYTPLTERLRSLVTLGKA